MKDISTEPVSGIETSDEFKFTKPEPSANPPKAYVTGAGKSAQGDVEALLQPDTFEFNFSDNQVPPDITIAEIIKSKSVLEKPEPLIIDKPITPDSNDIENPENTSTSKVPTDISGDLETVIESFLNKHDDKFSSGAGKNQRAANKVNDLLKVAVLGITDNGQYAQVTKFSYSDFSLDEKGPDGRKQNLLRLLDEHLQDDSSEMADNIRSLIDQFIDPETNKLKQVHNKRIEIKPAQGVVNLDYTTQAELDDETHISDVTDIKEASEVLIEAPTNSVPEPTKVAVMPIPESLVKIISQPSSSGMFEDLAPELKNAVLRGRQATQNMIDANQEDIDSAARINVEKFANIEREEIRLKTTVMDDSDDFSFEAEMLSVILKNSDKQFHVEKLDPIEGENQRFKLHTTLSNDDDWVTVVPPNNAEKIVEQSRFIEPKIAILEEDYKENILVLKNPLTQEQIAAENLAAQNSTEENDNNNGIKIERSLASRVAKTSLDAAVIPAQAIINTTVATASFAVSAALVVGLGAIVVNEVQPDGLNLADLTEKFSNSISVTPDNLIANNASIIWGENGVPLATTLPEETLSSSSSITSEQPIVNSDIPELLPNLGNVLFEDNLNVTINAFDAPVVNVTTPLSPKFDAASDDLSGLMISTITANSPQVNSYKVEYGESFSEIVEMDFSDIGGDYKTRFNLYVGANPDLASNPNMVVEGETINIPNASTQAAECNWGRIIKGQDNACQIRQSGQNIQLAEFKR